MGKALGDFLWMVTAQFFVCLPKTVPYILNWFLIKCVQNCTFNLMSIPKVFYGLQQWSRLSVSLEDKMGHIWKDFLGYIYTVYPSQLSDDSLFTTLHWARPRKPYHTSADRRSLCTPFVLHGLPSKPSILSQISPRWYLSGLQCLNSISSASGEVRHHQKTTTREQRLMEGFHCLLKCVVSWQSQDKRRGEFFL